MAENQNAPAVFAKSLKKVFANNKNRALDSVALNGIDLVVPKGGLVSLVGPDGAGKNDFYAFGLRVADSDFRGTGSLRYEYRNRMPRRFRNGSLTCLSVLDCIKT